MVDAAVRQSATVESTPWLRALPAATRFSFRGDLAAQAAAGRGFGLALPTTPCRAELRVSRAALWLGPDEHLLLAPPEEATQLKSVLADALRGVPHSLVDISHRQGALALRGAHAAWLLNVGCPLDLHETEFPVGMCTRTVFLKAEITLWRTAADSFHVEVWRSFTDYVVGVLREAARELPA